MAKVANAFTTYNAQANREDLSNAIYNIDPFDTPIMSAARRRNAKARTFDWQTENLPTVDTDNAQIEGFELARTASTPTVRLSNVTQISKRDATVTGSQEASDPAGKSSEMGSSPTSRPSFRGVRLVTTATTLRLVARKLLRTGLHAVVTVTTSRAMRLSATKSAFRSCPPTLSLQLPAETRWHSRKSWLVTLCSRHTATVPLPIC
jgi:hypothetical protein